MALFTATNGKQEIIAVTDKFGFYNIINSGGFLGLKFFRNFEEVKKNYKCFAKMSELALIDYDLNFKDFIDQFETGSKECDDLIVEITKWENFKEKLKIIRE